MVHQPDGLLGLALGINAAERQLQLGSSRLGVLLPRRKLARASGLVLLVQCQSSR
jgi:hypothetical protein